MLRSIFSGAFAAVLTVLLGGGLSAALAGPKVAFQTSAGDFLVELDEKAAPKTTANFLAYVDSGHYDGVIFHRVKPRFVIQGGGFALKEGEIFEKPTREMIENEAHNGLRNLRGTLSMARQPGPHTASAQFFINLKYNRFLDHRGKTDAAYGYAVFGRVIEGMETIDRIAGAETGDRQVLADNGRGGLTRTTFEDVPLKDVVILTARRAE